MAVIASNGNNKSLSLVSGNTQVVRYSPTDGSSTPLDLTGFTEGQMFVAPDSSGLGDETEIAVDLLFGDATGVSAVFSPANVVSVIGLNGISRGWYRMVGGDGTDTTLLGFGPIQAVVGNANDLGVTH